MTIGNRLKPDLECRALSLFERPKMSLSGPEVRIINRAVRDLWFNQKSDLLIRNHRFAFGGFFYHLKNEDKVYCNQNSARYAMRRGRRGLLNYRLTGFMKSHRLVLRPKYRAYLLEDFWWVRLYTHRQRNYFFGLLYDITEEVKPNKRN